MLVMRLWTFCSSKTGGMGRMITSIGMLWTSWILSEWIERFSLRKLPMFRLKIVNGFTLEVRMCFRKTPFRVWNITRKVLTDGGGSTVSAHVRVIFPSGPNLFLFRSVLSGKKLNNSQCIIIKSFSLNLVSISIVIKNYINNINYGYW